LQFFLFRLAEFTLPSAEPPTFLLLYLDFPHCLDSALDGSQCPHFEFPVLYLLQYFTQAAVPLTELFCALVVFEAAEGGLDELLVLFLVAQFLLF
jgi:hypothetical protein